MLGDEQREGSGGMDEQDRGENAKEDDGEAQTQSRPTQEGYVCTRLGHRQRGPHTILFGQWTLAGCCTSPIAHLQSE